jgi:DNA polymerase-2
MNSSKCCTPNGKSELCGWLLSLYPDEQEGAVLWLLGEDGKRYRLTQPCPVSFYVGAETAELRAVSQYLAGISPRPRTALTKREDLYQGPQQVLAIQVSNPIAQERLFRNLQRQFKHLRYYDAEIRFSIRYGASQNVFPMAHCRASLDESGRLTSLQALDSRWDIDYQLPPLRVMSAEPEVDPQHAPPNNLEISMDDERISLRLDDPRKALTEFIDLLESYDPDVIMAPWGDGWLFPTLAKWAQEFEMPFNPNRDKSRQALVKDELTYESYGTVHYRAGQTYLYGRWHIDPRNTAMIGGFSIYSAIELARLTCMPVQTAARNSPGAGFTALQIREALKRGVLVPLKKRQTESFKSALELNLADMGGLNYRPLVGLHAHVAILDYFGMYASLMSVFNISGETVGKEGKETWSIPRIDKPITQDVLGLVPAILKPLLAKRLKAKRLMAEIGKEDPRYPYLHSITDAIKWLSYVSFGYQGFLHNTFGSIEAHEAITAAGREVLTQAKECAHELGFVVLAANTDSLFVQKPGAERPEDFDELIQEIERRTGLVIMLQDLLDWLVFPPAKGNPRVGASNRYFGKLIDGDVKVRGLTQRRHDTPGWVRQAEEDIMALLATQSEAAKLKDLLPEAVRIMQERVERLYSGAVPLDELVVTNRLSREPEQYKGLSAPAEAARQLRAAGKQVRVGQMLGFVYVLGERPGVQAWDLPYQPGLEQLDKPRYCKLLLRAVYQLLLALGILEEDMYPLATEGVRQLGLWEAEQQPKYEIGTILPDEDNLAEALFGKYIRHAKTGSNSG